MFLMYCRRNFRWNACYLKMNMIQYSKLFYENQEDDKMKHIKTLTNKTLQNTVKKVDVVNARHLASQHVKHLVQ